MENISISLAEKGYLPDSVLRYGIRKRSAQVLEENKKPNVEEELKSKMEFVKSLKVSPIAIQTKEANKQHYEVPTEFFKLALGKNLKYSCCYYPRDDMTLDEAEDAMLSLYCEKLQIGDNMDVMDIGCGWGSFSLYAAKKFPNSRFTGLSNSNTQREFIMGEAKKRGITNLNILTNDINVFDTDLRFDRAISIEMFEHMKNYESLLKKISSWLKKDGMLFIHYFAHKDFAYHFKDGDWMSDHFFSGGTMPSDDLMLYFQNDLKVIDHWRLPGTHYYHTSNHWLINMDNNISKIKEIFEETYGKDNVIIWINRWRLFFLACAELFGYSDGQEWVISLYLFKKQ